VLKPACSNLRPDIALIGATGARFRALLLPLQDVVLLTFTGREIQNTVGWQRPKTPRAGHPFIGLSATNAEYLKAVLSAEASDEGRIGRWQ
jgi:hypothetical protein